MSTKGLALDVKIGAALNNTFKSTTLFASKSINALANQSKKLKDSQSHIAKYKDIGTIVQSQERKLTTAKQSLANLQNQIGKTNKPTRAMTHQFAKAQNEVEKLKKSVDDKRRSLNFVSGTLKKAGIDTHNLSTEEKRLAREVSRVEKVMKRKEKVGHFVASSLRKVKYAAIGLFGTMTALSVVSLKFVNSLGNHGDHVAKTADKLGLATDKLQALRYAAERTGVSTQTFDMAMQRMTRRVAEAANGTGEAKKTLEELNLSAQELNNLRPDQALGLIADKLKGVENASDRTRIAQKLFDSEGVALVNMLKSGSKALSDYEKEAHKLGYVLDEKTLRAAEENRDAFLNMKTTFKALSYQVGANLMPIFTESFKKIATWVSKNKDLIKQWSSNVFQTAVKFLPVFVEGLKELGSSLLTVGTAVNQVVGYLGGWKPVLTVITGLVGLKFVTALMGVTKAIGFTSIALKGLTVAFLTNPIGLAIAAIGTSVFLIYKYWEPIKVFFKNLWTGIQSVFSTSLDFISNLGGWYVNRFKKNISLIKDSFINLWRGVKNSASSVFNWIGNKISAIGDSISGVLSYFGFTQSHKSSKAIQSRDQIQRSQPNLDDLFRSRSIKEALQARAIANQTTNHNSRDYSTVKKTVNVTNQIKVSDLLSKQSISQAAFQGTQKALAMYDTEGGY